MGDSLAIGRLFGYMMKMKGKHIGSRKREFELLCFWKKLGRFCGCGDIKDYYCSFMFMMLHKNVWRRIEELQVLNLCEIEFCNFFMNPIRLK